MVRQRLVITAANFDDVILQTLTAFKKVDRLVRLPSPLTDNQQLRCLGLKSLTELSPQLQ